MNKKRKEYLDNVKNSVVFPHTKQILMTDKWTLTLTTFCKGLKVLENHIQDMADTCTISIVVLYHADLDGNVSGWMTMEYIDKLIRRNEANVSAVDVKVVPINYHYNIERYKDIIDDADYIFVVDYSLVSCFDHIDYLLNHTDSRTQIFWIDHHESSIVGINDSKSKYYAKINEFIKDNRVSYFLYTGEGCSAALECYIVYYHYLITTRKNNTECSAELVTIPQCIANDIATINGGSLSKTDILAYGIAVMCPEVVVRTSLHDTFHPLAERQFNLGISAVDTSPYCMEDSRSTEPAWTSILFRLRSLLDSLVDDNDVEVLIGVNAPFSGVFFRHVSIIDKVMDNGQILMDYDVNMHNRTRKANEYDIILSVEDQDGHVESYNVAVQNASGRTSYAFEDSYYDHDAVIIFDQAKDLNYIYSIYADKQAERKVPCRLIAESFNGGGHATAAGWQSKFNLFDPTSILLWGYGIEFCPRDDDQGSDRVLRIKLGTSIDLKKVQSKVPLY